MQASATVIYETQDKRYPMGNFVTWLRRRRRGGHGSGARYRLKRVVVAALDSNLIPLHNNDYHFSLVVVQKMRKQDETSSRDSSILLQPVDFFCVTLLQRADESNTMMMPISDFPSRLSPSQLQKLQVPLFLSTQARNTQEIRAEQDPIVHLYHTTANYLVTIDVHHYYKLLGR